MEPPAKIDLDFPLEQNLVILLMDRCMCNKTTTLPSTSCERFLAKATIFITKRRIKQMKRRFAIIQGSQVSRNSENVMAKNVK